MKKILNTLFTLLIVTVASQALAVAPIVGPKDFWPTTASSNSLYVSPSGTGTSCTFTVPCSIYDVVDVVTPGSVVFLRGGIYPISSTLSFYKSGTSSAPIIYESYTNEMAILDGSQHAKGTNVAINMSGSYTHLRKFTVRNMPMQGIWMKGTHNDLDSLIVHSNSLSGIQVYSPYDKFPYGEFGSYNTIRNCTVYFNVDQGHNSSAGFDNGGNADGISVSSGADNIIINNFVFGNSDDGIDAWRSTGTFIGFNLVVGNGLLDGNGNGIKAGGISPSTGTVVERNIATSNRYAGITFNDGDSISFINNTTWDNGVGYIIGSDTSVVGNLSVGDSISGTGYPSTDNSWQISGKAEILNFSVVSSSFMKVRQQTAFEYMGAKAP